MRTVGISMMFAMLVSASVACGGDDGGNTDNQGDDQTDDITVDDTTDNTTDDTTDNTTPDAPTSSAAQGIGKVCVTAMMGADCPASAPSCVILVQGAANGFCTASCGTSPDNMTLPPNGNQTCAAVTPAVPSGTPACVLYGAPTNGMVPWACGILCGTIDNNGTPVEAGNCPSGLTCTENLCQP